MIAARLIIIGTFSFYSPKGNLERNFSSRIGFFCCRLGFFQVSFGRAINIAQPPHTKQSATAEKFRRPGLFPIDADSTKIRKEWLDGRMFDTLFTNPSEAIVSAQFDFSVNRCLGETVK
jgi:hypothetical protein